MIKFSGDVVGFELADVDISGDAVVQTSSLMGRGSSYMLDITPHPDTDGDVIIQVPADVAVDAAQNNNAASAPQTVSVAPSWMPDADLRAAVRDLLNLAEGEDFESRQTDGINDTPIGVQPISQTSRGWNWRQTSRRWISAIMSSLISHP